MKTLPLAQAAYSVADESGLTLIGHVAFLDPPKSRARRRIEGRMAFCNMLKYIRMTAATSVVRRAHCANS
jgi:hypothetical protein